MDSMLTILQLLAADANDQIRSFPSYVGVADELALMLHDAVLLYEQETGKDGVPRWLLTPVKNLDATLDVLSGVQNASFWSNESLANDVRWQRLRVASRQLLQQLGVRRVLPNIDDTFVPINGLE